MYIMFVEYIVKMPIYTFSCSFCGSTQEELVPMDTKTYKCCKCAEVAIKVPSLSNFHLKGSGWYKDGYSKEQK